MKTEFSVIVPIYKVEKYLKKCLESILNQTYKNFELLLIDDGSPDSCPQICDEYAKKDERVKVIHKINGGLVSARNAGVSEARGEYVCYVDGDDWIKENLLETVYKKAIESNNPDIIVYNAVKQYDDKQVDIPCYINEGLYNKEKLEKEVYPYMIYDERKKFCTGIIFPVAWNKIFRTSLLKKHYCEEERIKMGEDNAFIFECLYFAESVYFCDDVLYFYNQLNSGSMTSNYDEKRFENNQLLTGYIQKRLGNKVEYLNYQINAFKAYWLIMAIFHEIKCDRKLLESSKHMRKSIKENEVLKDIELKVLPRSAQAFITLLKCKLYVIALIGAKIVNNQRENNI